MSYDLIELLRHDQSLWRHDLTFSPLWRHFQLLTLCRLYSKRANSQARKSAFELLAQLAQIKDGVVSEILTDSLFCVLLSMVYSDEQVRVAAQLAIVALSSYLSGMFDLLELTVRLGNLNFICYKYSGYSK